MRNRTGPSARGVGVRGFTLIELMVVIGVLAILVGITIVVGATVAGDARKSSTIDTVRSLDAVLGQYAIDQGVPTPLVSHPGDAKDGRSPIRQVAIADANINGETNSDGSPRMINSVGFLLSQLTQDGTDESLLAQIDEGSLKLFSPDGNDVAQDERQPLLRTVVDAWERPIRYVHPKFDGVFTDGDRGTGDAGVARRIVRNDDGYFTRPAGDQYSEADFLTPRIRRNFITEQERADAEASGTVLVGDGDGGAVVGGTPYFYSAGEDGDPSTREDNAYTSEPRFIDPA